MKVGTRSILFGAHAFWIHPFFVAWGWTKLYGFPFDPRLWFAFFVHDLGYWGKPNTDGDEGESHVFTGADIMYALFGDEWWDFCVYHSRFWSSKYDKRPSRLCYADKLAFVLTPWWLYRILANASGEIHEYMERSKAGGKYESFHIYSDDQRTWFEAGKAYNLKWIKEQTGAE